MVGGLLLSTKTGKPRIIFEFDVIAKTKSIDWGVWFSNSDDMKRKALWI